MRIFTFLFFFAISLSLFAEEKSDFVSNIDNQESADDTNVDNLSVYLKRLAAFLGDTVPNPDTLRVVHDTPKSDSIISEAVRVESNKDTITTAKDTMSITDYIMSTHNIDTTAFIPLFNSAFLPLIFEKHTQNSTIALADTSVTVLSIIESKKCDKLTLSDSAMQPFKESFSDMVMRDAVQYVMLNHPENVTYTESTVPKAPKPEKVSRSMRKNMISVELPKIVPQTDIPLETPPPPKKWKNNFASSIQVSQAYISENWYQGGESNFNLISDQLYNLSFDDKKRLLFTLAVEWKLGMNTAPSDTCHNLRINEDLFQVNSKFGVKAVKDWYYTIALQFKTQFFNSFQSNTDIKTASFFSPGELNLGVGLSYNRTIEPRKFTTSVMLAPLSYNLKFALSQDLAEKAGIKEQKLFENQVGSSVEATFKWSFYRNLTWNARFFYFTNYKYILSDIETGLDFAFNKYFSTKIYVHARFDDSVAKNVHGNHLQFKELLSFGFNYKF